MSWQWTVLPTSDKIEFAPNSSGFDASSKTDQILTAPKQADGADDDEVHCDVEADAGSDIAQGLSTSNRPAPIVGHDEESGVAEATICFTPEISPSASPLTGSSVHNIASILDGPNTTESEYVEECIRVDECMDGKAKTNAIPSQVGDELAEMLDKLSPQSTLPSLGIGGEGNIPTLPNLTFDSPLQVDKASQTAPPQLDGANSPQKVSDKDHPLNSSPNEEQPVSPFKTGAGELVVEQTLRQDNACVDNIAEDKAALKRSTQTSKGKKSLPGLTTIAITSCTVTFVVLMCNFMFQRDINIIKSNDIDNVQDEPMRDHMALEEDDLSSVTTRCKSPFPLALVESFEEETLVEDEEEPSFWMAILAVLFISWISTVIRKTSKTASLQVRLASLEQENTELNKKLQLQDCLAKTILHISTTGQLELTATLGQMQDVSTALKTEISKSKGGQTELLNYAKAILDRLNKEDEVLSNVTMEKAELAEKVAKLQSKVKRLKDNQDTTAKELSTLLKRLDQKERVLSNVLMEKNELVKKYDMAQSTARRLGVTVNKLRRRRRMKGEELNTNVVA